MVHRVFNIRKKMSTNKNDLNYLFHQLDEDVERIGERLNSLGKLLDIDNAKLSELGCRVKSVLSERSDKVDELILQAKQMGFGVPGMITPPHGKGNFREDSDKFSAKTLMDGKVIVYQGLTCIFDGDKWGYIVPIPHEKTQYKMPDDIKRFYAVPDNWKGESASFYPFKDRINDALKAIEEAGSVEFDPFAELKSAHADGKTIQVLVSKDGWLDFNKGLCWNLPISQYRIKPEEPKVGDVCKFWDDDESIFVIAILKSINKNGRHPFRSSVPSVSPGSYQWSNAKSLTPEEATELLFGKEVKNG